MSEVQIQPISGQIQTTEDQDFSDTKLKETSSLYHGEVIVKNQGASVLNATANVCKTGLGLGMFFMPLVFSKCGIYIPIIALAFFGILCFYCWNLLGLVLKHVEKSENYTKTEVFKTYQNNLILQNTMAIVFSPGWRIFTQTMNGLNIYGGCLGYVIFITQVFEAYVPYYILRISIIAALYFPLSFLKDIKAYGKFSSIGLTIYFIVILTIIGRSIEVINKGDYPNDAIILNGWNNILQYVGIFILAYDINGSVGIVHASMKEKNKFWIPLAVLACIIGCLLGLVGYFAYKDEIGDIIFKNIGSLNGGGDAILILYTITLMVSLCIFGFILTKMIDVAIFKKDEEEVRKTVPIYYRFPIRILFFVSLGTLAYVFPSASALFSLLGSIFGVLLTYILPIILYEKIYFHSKISLIRIANYFVMAIGAAGGIAGFTFSLKGLIDA